jgi:methionine-rich copper-binding protein CopC
VTVVRAIGRIVGLLTVVAGICIGLAGSASAHNVLISSNPPDGAQLATVPTSVTFTFDQPVQNFDPVVSLIGPDGRQYATGTPTVSGSTVSGSVSAGPAGAYIAAYRVVSADGHPVTGQVHFSLEGDDGAVPTVSGNASASTAGSGPPASGSAAVSVSAPSSSASLPAISGPQAGSGGLSAWLWIGLIAAAVVIAFAAVLLLRRPGGDRPRRNDY